MILPLKLDGAMSVLTDFYNYVRSSQELKQHEFIFLLNKKYFEETDNIKINTDIKKDWINRFKFDLFTGKKYIKSINPDLVISLQNTIVFGLKCKQFVYVHQAIPFQEDKKFSFLKKEERKYAIIQKIIGEIIKKSIKKADLTIVQTKWMKRAVMSCTHINEKNIITIMPKIQIEKCTDNLEFCNNYFFYPASNNLYKNHKCIYEACKILNENNIRDYRVDLTIDDGEAIDNINYVGKLPINNVYEKYISSTLVFPSYIETVGLPLIEAKENGAIILAANCDYSREVLEGYENAYFFNPFKPNELARLMKKIINKEIQNKKSSISKNKQTSDSWDKIFLLMEGNIK